MTQPQQPIAGAWRVSIEQTYKGEAFTNTLGVIHIPAGGPSNARAAQIAERVGEEWAARVIPLQHRTVRLLGATCYSLQDPSVAGSTTFSTAGGQQVADDSGLAVVSSAICANVRLLTDRRGRRYRGRTGVCGLPEADVDGNTLRDGYRSQLQVAFEGIRTAIATPESWEEPIAASLAVISETYALATPVSGIDVAARVGTRVRRLR